MAAVAVDQSRRLDWIDFRPIFVTYLHPNVTFLSHLPTLITTEEASELQNVIHLKSRQEAVNRFLQKLEKRKDQPGIFTSVVQALDNSNQGHIAEMLVNGQKVPNENTKRVKHLIDVFSVVLVQVDPMQMRQYLQCLNAEEQNEVENCTAAYSNERGAIKMFSLLVLKATTEMFFQLVEALRQTGHPDVARDLEDMQKSDCDCEDSDCCEEGEEHHLTISYQENQSVDNEDHPPELEDDLNDISQTQEGEPYPNPHQIKLNKEPMAQLRGGKIPACVEEAVVSHYTSQTSETTTASSARKTLLLRDYQMELAKPALPGPNGCENVIVVAPTSSGKTLVAVKVAMDFFSRDEMIVNGCSNVTRKARPKKVVFLVNQVTLVDQQSKVFQEYMGASTVIGLSGETAHGPLKPVLKEKSVLVMTAQILVNALEGHTVELSDIGLLILDECHNCQKGTPYNRIMSRYRDMKLNQEEPRPQVLGLSASLNIGQAKDDYQAESKILQFCANLDASVISTVHSPEGKKELQEFLNVPTEHIIEIAGRRRDRFVEEVEIIMKIIEEVMQETPEWVKVQDNNPQLKTPSSHGSQTYEQWVAQVQNEIAVALRPTTTAKAIRRRLIACSDHLKVYNDSLYINRDIRTKDAVNKLQAFLEELTRKEGGFDEIDRFLVDTLKGKMADFKAIADDPSSCNPVLDKLGNVLKDAFRTSEEITVKRGILFTRTRASVDALIKWIKETEELKFLQPGRLIGCGGSGGMTQNQQDNVLKQFREGDHKLLVATSVAQEGLDIAQCNVVVQYNCTSSVVAHVQAKGRNRAKGGQFFMVLDEQQKLGNKSLTNRIREKMMQKATDVIREKLRAEKAAFLHKIVELQKADQQERKQKSMNEACRQKKLSQDRVKLTCHKCGELACYSNEIRCIKDAHRVVTTDKFTERYDTRDNAKYPKLVDGLNMRMTIVCAKCKADWGTQAMYKGNVVPLINIAGFVAEYPNGKQHRAKKWKNAEFKVKAIAFEDLEKMLNVDESQRCEEEDVHEE